MAYDSGEGYFHLTPNGWERVDEEPFPANRIETWQYYMSQASGWSKEYRSLTCVWANPCMGRSERDQVRKKFDAPLGFGERSRYRSGGKGEPL